MMRNKQLYDVLAIMTLLAGIPGGVAIGYQSASAGGVADQILPSIFVIIAQYAALLWLWKRFRDALSEVQLCGGELPLSPAYSQTPRIPPLPGSTRQAPPLCSNNTHNSLMHLDSAENSSPNSNVVSPRGCAPAPGVLYGANCQVELTSCVLVLRLHGAGLRNTPNASSPYDLLELRALSERVLEGSQSHRMHMVEPSTGKLFVRVWGQDWAHTTLKACHLAQKVLPEFRDKKVSAAISKARHTVDAPYDFCCPTSVEACELLCLADLLRLHLILAAPPNAAVQELSALLEEAELPELAAVKSRIEGCTLWRQFVRRRLQRDTALCRLDKAQLSPREQVAQAFSRFMASSRQGIANCLSTQQSVWSAIQAAANEGGTQEDLEAAAEKAVRLGQSGSGLHGLSINHCATSNSGRSTCALPGDVDICIGTEMGKKGEDRCCIGRDLLVYDQSIRPGISFIGLFDGHAGSTAADFCAQQCGPELARRIALGQPCCRAAVDTLRWLDRRYHQGGGRCGTTGTLVVMTDTDVVVVWLGDSRVVAAMDLVTQAQGGDPEKTPPVTKSLTAVQLTCDHNLRNPRELALIEAKGGRGMQRQGTLRVDGTLEVSRSIGEGYVRPSVERTPEVASFPRKNMEFIIVASDGLWKMFENQAAVSAVGVARQLVDDAGSPGVVLSDTSSRQSSDRRISLSRSTDSKAESKAEIDYHAIAAGLAFDAAERAEGTAEKDDVTVVIAFFPKQHHSPL
eukprot:Hpha_TRINITY_DN14468_c0_g1::TRINITY_DN14468_c0_g1_i1::g.158033::m.158033